MQVKNEKMVKSLRENQRENFQRAPETGYADEFENMNRSPDSDVFAFATILGKKDELNFFYLFT